MDLRAPGNEAMGRGRPDFTTILQNGFTDVIPLNSAGRTSKATTDWKFFSIPTFRMYSPGWTMVAAIMRQEALRNCED